MGDRELEPDEPTPQLDEIGNWSEIKHEIIKRYAEEYSLILTRQKRFRHHYIDAFSGSGEHLRKGSHELVKGSPLHALDVNPPFNHYHFIDLDGKKAKYLQKKIGNRADVSIYHGDCNEVLLKEVFPVVRYSDYQRALCLLDPYKLSLSWKIIQWAGRERSIEVFLNFPIHDINRNALRRDPSKVRNSDKARMDTYWGDDSWFSAAYSDRNLFHFDEKINDGNKAITEAFRKRLEEKAGFSYVPPPIPMRTKAGAIVYYLYFASPNRTGATIVEYIFNKFRDYRA